MTTSLTSGQWVQVSRLGWPLVAAAPPLAVVPDDLHPLARGGRVDADDPLLGRAVTGRARAVGGERGDRHLHHDRHDVDAVGGRRAADPEQVEDVEVDEERLVARAGEELHAVRAADRLGSDALVGAVGEAAVADVPGRHRDVGGDDVLVARHLVDADDVVALPDVEVLVVERRDRPGVVEEGVAVLHPGLEQEPVDEVGAGVAVVVDPEVVGDVVGEAVEVGPRARDEQRDVVGHHHQVVRVLRADEGVDVGVVGELILADGGRLAVARGRRQGRQAGHGDAGGERRGVGLFRSHGGLSCVFLG
jgi:hypothetical protein